MSVTVKLSASRTLDSCHFLGSPEKGSVRVQALLAQRARNGKRTFRRIVVNVVRTSEGWIANCFVGGDFHEVPGACRLRSDQSWIDACKFLKSVSLSSSN